VSHIWTNSAINFLIDIYFTEFTPKLFYGRGDAASSVHYNTIVHLDSESEGSDDDEIFDRHAGWKEELHYCN